MTKKVPGNIIPAETLLERDRDWTKSKIFRLLKFYLIFVKDTVKRIKITIHELREKTFKIYINKGLLSKIYKNALKN